MEAFLVAGLECEVAVTAVLLMLGDELDCVRCEALRVLAEMMLNTSEDVIASVTPETTQRHRAVSILHIGAKQNKQGPPISTFVFQMANDLESNSDMLPTP